MAIELLNTKFDMLSGKFDNLSDKFDNLSGDVVKNLYIAIGVATAVLGFLIKL